MDIQAEMERDRRRIRAAVIWSVIGTTVLIMLIAGSTAAIRLAATTRCPTPPAGITVPR